MSSHEEKWLFSFSAKSLQSFVMEGGKLRDMVGATALIDELCSEVFLQRQASVCGAQDSDFEIVQAAAGSGKILFSKAAPAKMMARLWPLFCSAWAPGLEVVQDLSKLTAEKRFSDVLQESAEAMEMRRRFPSAPEMSSTPVMKTAPRSGRAAVVTERGSGEVLDASLERKREKRNEFKKDGSSPKIYADCGLSKAEIPDDFEALVGSERGYMAIVHADANGLGQLFLSLTAAITPEMDDGEVRVFFKAFSDLIADVTADSVKEAIATVQEDASSDSSIEPHAILPIVLAGDDLTLVCRAELALDFSKNFLSNFENKMMEGVKGVKGPKPLTKILRKWTPSAGAGIVFCQPSYPFSRAYELVESLASFAKTSAKEQASENAGPGSNLAFFRVTGSSASESLQDLREREWRGDEVSLCGGPYWVTPGPNGSNTLAELEEFVAKVRGLSKGKARDVLSYLRDDSARVIPLLERLKVTEEGGLDEDVEAEALKTVENRWLDALTLIGVNLVKKNEDRKESA